MVSGHVMADSLAPVPPVEFVVGLFAEHGDFIAFVQAVLDVLSLFTPSRDLIPNRLAVYPLLALSDSWRMGQRKTGYRLSLTVMAHSRICAEPAIEGHWLVLH
jgi:hypothetical protein